MAFWLIMVWIVGIATFVGFVVGLTKQKEDPGAWLGYAIAPLIMGTGLGLIVCLIGSVFLMGEWGEKRDINIETFKVAENSRMDSEGRTLEFTYLDSNGRLQQYEKWMDRVSFEGGRDTVTVETYTWVKPGIMPWDVTTAGREAVVK